ncbi:MAG: hypothetical protein Q9214_000816 [Letrouitia sp. 1 TL-2023]
MYSSMEGSIQNLDSLQREALEARWRELTRLLELPEVSKDKLAVTEELDYIVRNQKGLLTMEDSENASFQLPPSELTQDPVAPTAHNTMGAGHQNMSSGEANPQHDESSTDSRIAKQISHSTDTKTAPNSADQANRLKETEIAPNSAKQTNCVTPSDVPLKREGFNFTEEQQLLIKSLIQDRIKSGDLDGKSWASITSAVYNRTKIFIGPLTIRDFWNSEGRAKFGLDERMVREPKRGEQKVDKPGTRQGRLDLLDNNDNLVPSEDNDNCTQEPSQMQNNPPNSDTEKTQEQSSIQDPSKITSRLPGLSVNPFDLHGSEPEIQVAKPTKRPYKRSKPTKSRQDSSKSRSGILSDQRRQLIELASSRVPTKNLVRKRTGKPPQLSIFQRTRPSSAEAMDSDQETRMNRQRTSASLPLDHHKSQSPASQTVEEQVDQSEQQDQPLSPLNLGDYMIDESQQEDRPLSPLNVGDCITSDWLARAKEKFRKRQSSTGFDSIPSNVVIPPAPKTPRRRKRRASAESDPYKPLRRSGRIAENRMQTARVTRSATKTQKKIEMTKALDTLVHTRRKRAAKTNKGQEAQQAHRTPSPELRQNEDEASESGEFFDAKDYLSSSD